MKEAKGSYTAHFSSCSFLGFTAVLGLSLCCVVAGGADQPPPEEAKDAGLQLRIAVCLNKPGPTLALIAENKGKKDVVTSGLSEKANRLVVTRPDGRRLEGYWTGPYEPIVIRPSETKIWYSDMRQKSILWFNTPGVYRVRWKVNDVESPEILILNEEQPAPNKKGD